MAPETLDPSIFAPRRGASSDFQEKCSKTKGRCTPPRLPEPFWHHLGSQNGAPRPHFLSFFEHFGVLFWSPSPVAPLGLASMLISWPSLPSCFGSAVCFQKWGPPSGVHLSSFLSSSLACSWSLFVLCRLRSLHFESWKTSRPQAPSGRRGSRSDQNFLVGLAILILV